jgi:hypothetical protein
MLKLVFCLRRRPELTPEEFRQLWSDHGRLAISLRQNLPQIKRYVQSHTIDTPRNEALSSLRGGTIEPYDGITEAWIDDLGSTGLTPEQAEATMRQLLADEARFLDHPRCAIFLTEEHEIF